MSAPAPAPASTSTSRPAARYFPSSSGTRATRRSEGARSRTTPTFMRGNPCRTWSISPVRIPVRADPHGTASWPADTGPRVTRRQRDASLRLAHETHRRRHPRAGPGRLHGRWDALAFGLGRADREPRRRRRPSLRHEPTTRRSDARRRPRRRPRHRNRRRISATSSAPTRTPSTGVPSVRRSATSAWARTRATTASSSSSNEASRPWTSGSARRRSPRTPADCRCRSPAATSSSSSSAAAPAWRPTVA